MSSSVPIESSFASRVIRWGRRYGRHDLPWQIDRSAYRVWVSEIMLQQTQVSTVLRYFSPFVERFPSIEALAEGSEDSVLALWSGLGYYARARNLHRAAQQVCANHGGQLPEDVDALRQLAGIGRSTAGAILSLACAQRQPILDGNVKRVLARHRAIPGWPGQAAVNRELWQLADELTPHRQVAQYTQAMMDIGAIVCTRNRPSCEHCPLSSDCLAYQQGQTEQFPGRKLARAKPRRAIRMLLICTPDRNRLLLEKRPARGIWGGLWGFPECAVDQTVEHWLARHFERPASTQSYWSAIDHTFTHFRLQITPVVITLGQNPQQIAESDHWLWCNPAEMPEVGLAAPVAELLGRFRDWRRDV